MYANKLNKGIGSGQNLVSIISLSNLLSSIQGTIVLLVGMVSVKYWK